MTNTNQLTREISSVIYPKAVLIAYVSEDEKKHFLEMRAIDKNGNMGEGRPVTLEFMNDLVRNYSEVHDSTPCGILPSNLLYCDTRKGSERYVWYNPPQRRMMYFVESLKIENAEYNVPGVIYESKEGGGMNEKSPLRRQNCTPPRFSTSRVPACAWGIRKLKVRGNRHSEHFWNILRKGSG